jgi:hypothetical protein
MKNKKEIQSVDTTQRTAGAKIVRRGRGSWKKADQQHKMADKQQATPAKEHVIEEDDEFEEFENEGTFGASLAAKCSNRALSNLLHFHL